MLNHIAAVKSLKKHFPIIDAVIAVWFLRRKAKKIKVSNQPPFFLRKGTKDHETFKEIFVDNIYNLPLPIEPKIIIDAGANVGLASRFFKLKYPESDIVLIEIDQNNLQMIHKNLKGYSNITILNQALYNSTAYFKVENPYNATNSFVITEADQEDFDVKAVTIDQIMKDQGWDTVDILKIDIEGAEKKVFESNYESWLPKVKVVYVETHDRMLPKCAVTVIKALDACDFGLYTTTEGGTLVFYHKEFL